MRVARTNAEHFAGKEKMVQNKLVHIKQQTGHQRFSKIAVTLNYQSTSDTRNELCFRWLNQSTSSGMIYD